MHRENVLLSRQKNSCWTNELQHWISQVFAGFMVYVPVGMKIYLHIRGLETIAA